MRECELRAEIVFLLSLAFSHTGSSVFTAIFVEARRPYPGGLCQIRQRQQLRVSPHSDPAAFAGCSFCVILGLAGVVVVAIVGPLQLPAERRYRRDARLSPSDTMFVRLRVCQSVGQLVGRHLLHAFGVRAVACECGQQSDGESCLRLLLMAFVLFPKVSFAETPVWCPSRRILSPRDTITSGRYCIFPCLFHRPSTAR